MSILDWIILIPIAAAIAIIAGAPARVTALAAAGLNLAAGLVAWAQFDPAVAGYQFVRSCPVLANPELNFSVGADGMTIILVLLTVIVTVGAIWMSPKVTSNQSLYYAGSMLIAAGALGAFCATDLFFFFAFHELALIPTFLMIGIWGTGEYHHKAAWKITIYLGTASLVLLAGLMALYFASGSTSFQFDKLAAAAAGLPPETQNWIFLTLLIGFGTLVSLFPFHTWAAPAYAAAPVPTAMLHAGVLKKFGLYGLLRVAVPMLPEGAAHWTNLVLVLLLGNILYVGMVTIASKRLDNMLGNSSVMHMGYIFLGIFSFNTIGTQGAVLLMFAHGLSIALLFALSGRIRESEGTLEFARLGGLGKLMPVLAFTFALAGFASIGLPGFANFASEVMVFFGAFHDYLAAADKQLAPLQKATILALLGVVISAVYMLRAYRAIFQGERTDPSEEIASTAGRPANTDDAPPEDLPLLQRLPAALLLAALIAAGCAPTLLLRLLQTP